MTNVADLRPEGCDSLGQLITCFYGRKPPEYAVYSIHRRVLVHFADDPAKEDEQRRDLSQLAALRGEIDGLIDGWRSGTRGFFTGDPEKLRSKAARYDRRVGDALVIALEDDLTGARLLLEQIKQDILNERVAWARFEYLIAAFATALGLMFVAWLVASAYPTVGDFTPREDDPVLARMRASGAVILLLTSLAGLGAYFGYNRGSPAGPGHGANPSQGADEAPQPPSRFWPSIILFLLLAIPVFAIFIAPSFHHYQRPATEFENAVNLWRAAAAGSVGGFFSIALAIRTRTVLTDLSRTSNMMDAALRITIGFIGGAVLMALLLLKVVQFSFGAESFDVAGPLAVVVVGFLAGFSERLVPDLLDKANFKAAAASPSLLNSDRNESDRAVRKAREQAAAEGAETKAAAAADEADPIPEQSTEDACVADIDLDDEDVTPDADLPPATGGVEARGQEGESR